MTILTNAMGGLTTGFSSSELVELGQFSTIAAQDPTGTGLGGVIKINFGAGDSTLDGEIDLAASGILTVNTGEVQYLFELVLRIQRIGNPGVSRIVGRFMYAPDGIELNAAQVGDTFTKEVDNANSVWFEDIPIHFTPATGSVIWFELGRDESGDDSGGLGTFQPSATLVGWNQSSSARLTISRSALT